METSIIVRAVDVTTLFPQQVIGNDEDMSAAATAISTIRNALKQLEDERKSWVGPLNDTVKRLNNEFKRMSDLAEKENSRITRLMSEYRAGIEAMRKAEYERRQKEEVARQAAGVAPASPIPEVVAPIPVQEQKTIRTETGKVTFMDVWQYEIIDYVKIPREYLMIDTAKITRMVKAGMREIPGVRIFCTQVPSVRT